MIKIEPAKNFTTPKNGLSKTNGISSESENYDGDGIEGSGDFARVMENLTSKKDSSDEKTNLTKTKEPEKDSHPKLEQHSKTVQQPKDKTINHETKHEEVDGAAAAAAAAARGNNNDSSTLDAALPVPLARSILHIIDLERIVSSVRSQNFDGNSQVVITLKNSVCSGLQIKLTADENHRVTAELIAANDKVKAQIDARSGELADLLRQRGLKLTSLQTSVGSDASGQNGNRQQLDNAETSPGQANSVSNLALDDEQPFEMSETASNYRV